jgi:hypothetical protein
MSLSNLKYADIIYAEVVNNYSVKKLTAARLGYTQKDSEPYPAG